MYQKRLSGYASIGYKVKTAPMRMENSDIAGLLLDAISEEEPGSNQIKNI